MFRFALLLMCYLRHFNYIIFFFSLFRLVAFFMFSSVNFRSICICCQLKWNENNLVATNLYKNVICYFQHLIDLKLMEFMYTKNQTKQNRFCMEYFTWKILIATRYTFKEWFFAINLLYFVSLKFFNSNENSRKAAFKSYFSGLNSGDGNSLAIHLKIFFVRNVHTTHWYIYVLCCTIKGTTQ